MSDDQKLDAIRRGEAGSYNLSAPRSVDPFELTAFQHLAALALGIAKGRGYFFRCVPQRADIAGLLVNIPAALKVAAS